MTTLGRTYELDQTHGHAASRLEPPTTRPAYTDRVKERLDQLDYDAAIDDDIWATAVAEPEHRYVRAHIANWSPDETTRLTQAISRVLELHGEDHDGNCRACPGSPYPCRTFVILASGIGVRP